MSDETKDTPKKKMTSAEVEALLEDIRLRTAQAQLAEAEMKLEMTEETVRLFKASKEQRARTNAQRQSQMEKDRENIAIKARNCTHRQGGSPKNPYGGKGTSALSRVMLPDGHSEVIMCSVCPLTVFSPRDDDMAKRRRPKESEAQAEKRVERYYKAKAEWDKLMELALDKLTDEAAAPMHCGVTFTLRDGEGREVLAIRPCDSYAQGLDNRQGARA